MDIKTVPTARSCLIYLVAVSGQLPCQKYHLNEKQLRQCTYNLTSEQTTYQQTKNLPMDIVSCRQPLIEIATSATRTKTCVS